MKKAFLQLHLAVFLAGFTGILGYLIKLNGLMLIFYRMIITIIILYISALILHKPFKLKLKNKKKIHLIGLLLTIHWICFYQSIKLANISVAVLSLSATSTFTSILDPIINKKKIKIMELLLGLGCIIGMYIIFKTKTDFGWGIFVGLLCAFFASLFTIYNKHLAEKLRPNTLLFYQMKSGLLYCSIAVVSLLIFNKFDDTLFHYIPTIVDVFWIIILSVFCTIFLQQLNIASLQFISSFTNNLVYNLETIYSILLAFILFNEQHTLNTGFYVGSFIIFVSIVLQKMYIYNSLKKK